MEEKNNGPEETRVDPSILRYPNAIANTEVPVEVESDGISWYTVTNMFKDLKKSIIEENNRTRLQIAEQGGQLGMILYRCNCHQRAKDNHVNDFSKESETRGQPHRPVTSSGRCFNMVCRPPKEMVFCGKELAITTYIYNDVLPKLKSLVDFKRGTMTRETMLSLMYGEILKDEVIDMVVDNLADEKDQLRWFLPTEFLHMALNPLEYDEARVDCRTEQYMGKYEDVSKVYSPMVRDGHWFLLVIDAQFDTMTYYDSLKDET
ncbi:hypothetical protein PIB30_072935 [Stylosanthes scabra]|uniref:Ubiquitin-like protease family profile domain-containing protein n=1 Tax=Stylosanthes scabra TaxID=79078 RepID=A0ABU6QPC4_9FABA|nr:hypothetical protein [Stylosanthes scabra]